MALRQQGISEPEADRDASDPIRSDVLRRGGRAGAAAGANWPLLKQKFGPVVAAAIAGASSALGESYADLAKNVAEKVEAVQDAMAEMKEGAASHETTEAPRHDLD